MNNDTYIYVCKHGIVTRLPCTRKTLKKRFIVILILIYFVYAIIYYLVKRSLTKYLDQKKDYFVYNSIGQAKY